MTGIPTDADDKSARETETFRIPWVGLEVERRTDLLALTAFALALGGAIFQAAMFLRGPQPVMFPVEQLMLKFSPVQDGERYLWLYAHMAYVNSGAKDENTTLTRETVTFKFEDSFQEFDAAWLNFVTMRQDGSTDYLAEAIPQTLEGGKSLGHATEFAPRPHRCTSPCNPNRDFITEAQFFEMTQEGTKLTVTFTAKFESDKEPLKRICRISGTDYVDRMAIRGYAPLVCDP